MFSSCESGQSVKKNTDWSDYPSDRSDYPSDRSDGSSDIDQKQLTFFFKKKTLGRRA